MSLADLIRKRETGNPASANPAKAANDGQGEVAPLAKLAKLALAVLPESISDTEKRIEKMVAKLESDPGLRYAMEAHNCIEPDSVTLTLAIRGKGACELCIPREKYDPFLLLDLIERHSGKMQ